MCPKLDVLFDLEATGGGHPALDFINTVDNRLGLDPLDDYLHTYDDVVQWHVKTGLLSKTVADAVRGQAAAHPRQAAAAFQAAIDLREALYRIFIARARAGKVADADVEVLNRVLTSARAQQRLTTERDGNCCWHWAIDTGHCENLLAFVADDAAALLTSEACGRVKECPPPDGCGWLFLDTSRNRSRHWCSMKTCGNVAKVRRFREKQAAN